MLPQQFCERHVGIRMVYHDICSVSYVDHEHSCLILDFEHPMTRLSDFFFFWIMGFWTQIWIGPQAFALSGRRELPNWQFLFRRKITHCYRRVDFNKVLPASSLPGHFRFIPANADPCILFRGTGACTQVVLMTLFFFFLDSFLFCGFLTEFTEEVLAVPFHLVFIDLHLGFHMEDTIKLPKWKILSLFLKNDCEFRHSFCRNKVFTRNF